MLTVREAGLLEANKTLEARLKEAEQAQDDLDRLAEWILDNFYDESRNANDVGAVDTAIRLMSKLKGGTHEKTT